ncbi:MAG: tRNA pseudouridine(38-40) synthase TruA [Gammaproteobacteria bacterium]|nr:MAG: tRNA pseudouridine(38-40) synthase TruA [Pseudomonadota bacterium]PIE38025.1 MAG: tRNA pseudouridine(38-40) synthase TruA [Gammaproteobacteria bacterium]
MNYPISYTTTAPVGAGRVVCVCEYDGTAYHGWQAQKSGLPTIQLKLESALSFVANEKIEIVCAGRTDASVHACHQVIHFDTSAVRNMRSWVFGVNTHLPDDIAVHWFDNTDTEFSARFSATARTYRYFIYNGPIRPAAQTRRLTWCYQPLDEREMHKAAQCLVGENDYSSFRAAECQSNTPFRNVEFVRVRRLGMLVEIEIKANAFLHHMVRNIAGVLMAVGAGEKPASWVQEVLDARDRKKGGVTAKPFGLYLSGVDYPGKYPVPQLPITPFFM